MKVQRGRWRYVGCILPCVTPPYPRQSTSPWKSSAGVGPPGCVSGPLGASRGPWVRLRWSFVPRFLTNVKS
ncbi:hypothetical protein FKM82_030735 [Ascaphus truei]